MKRPMLRIVPMLRSHIEDCAAITASSEPWKTLNEQIDFLPYLASKQAFVAVQNGTVAGFVIFTPEPVFARGGYLRAVGVAADRRRNGIGGKLLAFAENKTCRTSENLYLCVSSFNRRACAFYRSRGYALVGKIPGLIRPDRAECIYWKRLRQLSHAIRRSQT